MIILSAYPSKGKTPEVERFCGLVLAGGMIGYHLFFSMDSKLASIKMIAFIPVSIYTLVKLILLTDGLNEKTTYWNK